MTPVFAQGTVTQATAYRPYKFNGRDAWAMYFVPVVSLELVTPATYSQGRHYSGSPVTTIPTTLN